ncbi:MAG: hypothetical protein F6K47_25770 [Symploca sp. SIO2E6]|nr:hypothetical protein [Symploca sp. SIO2E6]
MNPSSSLTEQVIEISRSDRWSVYRRLQELAIPCSCKTEQPLRVQINNATAAIQLWSVVRQMKLSRRDSVYWLEKCWKITVKRK